MIKKRKAHLVREGEVGGLGRKGKSFLLEGGNSFPSTEEEKHIISGSHIDLEI